MASWETCLTYSAWVPLSCAAIELLLPPSQSLEVASPNVLFWGCHPIRYVYLTGTVYNLRVHPAKDDKNRVEFEIDDGTGPAIPVIIFQADKAPCDESQFAEIYGSINVYHKKTGVVAIEVKPCEPNLKREIDLKFEALRVQTEVLSKPEPLPARADPGANRGFLSLSRLPSEISDHPKFRLLQSI